MKFAQAVLENPVWEKMLSKSQRASPVVVMGTAGAVTAVTAIQLFTDWDPLGRCFVFWKQLRGHVRRQLFCCCTRMSTAVKMLTILIRPIFVACCCPH